MAPEKVVLEVARTLLEFTPAELSESGSHLALCWGRQQPAGSRGSVPDVGGGPGGEAPGICLTLLPIFEHGLQFRFNKITYFLKF